VFVDRSMKAYSSIAQMKSIANCHNRLRSILVVMFAVFPFVSANVFAILFSIQPEGNSYLLGCFMLSLCGVLFFAFVTFNAFAFALRSEVNRLVEPDTDGHPPPVLPQQGSGAGAGAGAAGGGKPSSKAPPPAPALEHVQKSMQRLLYFQISFSVVSCFAFALLVFLAWPAVRTNEWIFPQPDDFNEASMRLVGSLIVESMAILLASWYAWLPFKSGGGGGAGGPVHHSRGPNSRNGSRSQQGPGPGGRPGGAGGGSQGYGRPQPLSVPEEDEQNASASGARATAPGTIAGSAGSGSGSGSQSHSQQSPSGGLLVGSASDLVDYGAGGGGLGHSHSHVIYGDDIEELVDGPRDFDDD
jgi:hypothetical protein